MHQLLWPPRQEILQVRASRHGKLCHGFQCQIYRSFRPQDSTTPSSFFDSQLVILKNAITSNTYLLGDFNLDARMDMRPDYDRKAPLSCLVNFALENDLIQIVTGTTWSRIINGIKKESLIDHAYVNNPASIINVFNKSPIFGDHSIVVVELTFKPLPEVNTHTKRCWKNYDIFNLNCRLATDLATVNYNSETLSVQELWSLIENVIINVIDDFAPLTSANSKIIPLRKRVPPNIKLKINKRKRLLKSDKFHNSILNSTEIKVLTKEIKDYFVGIKIGNIRKASMGVNANLWKAVKLAKNLTTNDLPANLTLGGKPVAGSDVANSFAKHSFAIKCMNMSL